MKKSEAITDLKFWIDDNTSSFNPDSFIVRGFSGEELEELSHHLLKTILDMGFSIPATTISNTDDDNNPTWEKEDE